MPIPDFQGGGLFPFGGEGIVACVAAVPAKFLRGLDGQVEGIVIAAIHQDHLRAEHQQLGDFGRRGSCAAQR